MRVVVTGANGFLGRHVVARLLERGHDVCAVVRPSSPAPSWPAEVDVFRADLRGGTNLAPALEGADAVIHLAAATSGDEDIQFASTVVGTERLLDAMAHSAVKRVVQASSLVVYDWGEARGRMDEDTPLATDIYSMDPYTIAKHWQERIVRRAAQAHGWELTVLRPGFIWGREHAKIAGMGRVIGSLYLMFGPATRLPLVHVENCADCFVVATENPAAVGQVLNVIDDDRVRVWRYAREHARRTGRRGIPVPLPYAVGLGLAHVASFMSRLLFGRSDRLPGLLTPRRFEAQFKPLRFSNRRLREVLGWTPPLTFGECLDRTYGP